MFKCYQQTSDILFDQIMKPTRESITEVYCCMFDVRNADQKENN